MVLNHPFVEKRRLENCLHGNNRQNDSGGEPRGRRVAKQKGWS